MQTIWKRIEDWLHMHAPELVSLLQPGASEESIRQTEALLHVTFPEDIKASYRIHNGSGDRSPEAHFIVRSRALLSLQGMVDTWHIVYPDEKQYPDEAPRLNPAGEEREADNNWRSVLSPEQRSAISVERVYTRQLIPVLRSFDEGLLCFDTARIHNTYGMIIEDFAQSGFSFTAASWRDLLSSFADDLEAGRYHVEHWNKRTSLRFNDPTQSALLE